LFSLSAEFEISKIIKQKIKQSRIRLTTAMNVLIKRYKKAR
jgi:hypothetical protein